MLIIIIINIKRLNNKNKSKIYINVFIKILQ